MVSLILGFWSEFCIFSWSLIFELNLKLFKKSFDVDDNSEKKSFLLISPHRFSPKFFIWRGGNPVKHCFKLLEIFMGMALKRVKLRTPTVEHYNSLKGILRKSLNPKDDKCKISGHDA